MNEDVGEPEKIETVVTYLEMTAPPRHPEVPPVLGKLALLRAEAPTLSFYRYLYDAVGRPWAWVDRKRLSDDELAAIIQDPAVEIYVLYMAGVPAGYAELDLRDRPEIELAYMGLMPEAIGKGLGPYLLDWVIRRAWEESPSRLWVHTCTLDHPKALALYQRFGFKPYMQRTEDVDPEV
jgi:GNAT superfamily N-acetyltransferase